MILIQYILLWVHEYMHKQLKKLKAVCKMIMMVTLDV